MIRQRHNEDHTREVTLLVGVGAEEGHGSPLEEVGRVDVLTEEGVLYGGAPYGDEEWLLEWVRQDRSDGCEAFEVAAIGLTEKEFRSIVSELSYSSDDIEE